MRKLDPKRSYDRYKIKETEAGSPPGQMLFPLHHMHSQANLPKTCLWFLTDDGDMYLDCQF